MLCRIACSWKLCVPINDNNSETRLICKAVARVRPFRFLVVSLSFIPTNITKVYENNVELVSSITDNNIAPRLRHTDIPLACLNYEYMRGIFQEA